MCKLTDFSPHEISTLIRALADYKKSLTNSIEIAKTYSLNHTAHSEELINVDLLIVQALTAKNIIYNREAIEYGN